MESFEDLFVDTRPVAKSNRPKPPRKAQESTMTNVKPFRFVLPESPSPEPDPGRRAPTKPKGKGKERARARAAPSRSSTATAEDTDGAEEGGVKKRSRQSPVLVSPSAELEVPPPGTRELLIPPSRRGESKMLIASSSLIVKRMRHQR